jgi:hypothetical protein
MCIVSSQTQISPSAQADGKDYFFLCLFFLSRFLRLCVAILCFFLFFPLGIVMFLPLCPFGHLPFKGEREEGS